MDNEFLTETEIYNILNNFTTLVEDFYYRSKLAKKLKRGDYVSYENTIYVVCSVHKYRNSITVDYIKPVPFDFREIILPSILVTKIKNTRLIEILYG
jgi:hypothetical protein